MLQSGVPTPLEQVELTAFSEYINDVQPAGISPAIVSIQGDNISVNADIVVDHQVINRSTGALLVDDSVFPVFDAVNNYISTFQNENFGGTFFANRMLAAIMQVDGVINATPNEIVITSANGAIKRPLDDANRSAVTESGYLIFDQNLISYE